MSEPLNEFVIFYQGAAVVVVKNLPPILPTEVLKAYSEFSGFPLTDLTWADVNKVDWFDIRPYIVNGNSGELV